MKWKYMYSKQHLATIAVTAKDSSNYQNYAISSISQFLMYIKKFIQVGIDPQCIHTTFGGHGLSDFGNKISCLFKFSSSLSFLSHK